MLCHETMGVPEFTVDFSAGWGQLKDLLNDLNEKVGKIFAGCKEYFSSFSFHDFSEGVEKNWYLMTDSPWPGSFDPFFDPLS